LSPFSPLRQWFDDKLSLILGMNIVLSSPLSNVLKAKAKSPKKPLEHIWIA
jgi:hypothetical protein